MPPVSCISLLPRVYTVKKVWPNSSRICCVDTVYMYCKLHPAATAHESHETAGAGEFSLSQMSGCVYLKMSYGYCKSKVKYHTQEHKRFV